jgi:lipoate-protein ligase A
MLRCIQRTETDPYFNLAAEEFLLKNAASDTFMTWYNEPSVIIGKHQNAHREINHSFIEANQIPVIRRITGGGTVYHDPGNLNFSFIFTNRSENLVDFKEFTKPVILFLRNLGLNATFEGKNNIMIDGLKVSGNSAHLYKKKVLYHGTLLFNSDLGKLDSAIASHEHSYKDKAVNSVRTRVVNVSGLLHNPVTKENFIQLFNQFIFNYFKDISEDVLLPDEVKAIRLLATEKYRTYKWNFGYSPDYDFNKNWSYKGDEYIVNLSVKGGIILNASISGPFKDMRFPGRIRIALMGITHEKKSIFNRLSKLNFADETEVEFVNQMSNYLF